MVNEEVPSKSNFDMQKKICHKKVPPLSPLQISAILTKTVYKQVLVDTQDKIQCQNHCR